MGYLEDHYDRLERQNADAAQTERVAEYNRWVGIIRRYGPKVVAQYLKNPPDDIYRFVIVDGVRQISWNIYTQYWDNNWTVGYLSDGSLVYTNNGGVVESTRITTFRYDEPSLARYLSLNDFRDIGQYLWQVLHNLGIEIDFDHRTGR